MCCWAPLTLRFLLCGSEALWLLAFLFNSGFNYFCVHFFFFLFFVTLLHSFILIFYFLTSSNHPPAPLLCFSLQPSPFIFSTYPASSFPNPFVFPSLPSFTFTSVSHSTPGPHPPRPPPPVRPPSPLPTPPTSQSTAACGWLLTPVYQRCDSGIQGGRVTEPAKDIM